MKKIILTLTIAAIGTILLSCNKSNGPDTTFEPVTKTTSDIYSSWSTEPNFSGQWINLDNLKADKVFIVNSQSEMDKFIADDAVEVPQIDFTDKTLLLVWGGTTSGIQTLTKEFWQTELNEFALNVDITLNDATVCEKWVIAMTTSKIAVDSITLIKTSR